MRDIELSKVDQVLLEKSANLEVTKKRTKMAIVFPLVTLACVLFLYFRDVPAHYFVFLMVVYMLITTYERVAYSFAVLAYKTLIQKLAAHIDQLENQTGKK